MKFVRALAFAFSSLFVFSHAWAVVIYENGALQGVQAATISPPQALSNSFTVGQESLLTSATLGLWSRAGSQPLSLTWSIGSSPFAADLGSATVLLSNAAQFTSGSFVVYLSRFTLDLALDAGSYWLTLGDGESTNDPFLGWDINNGPSRAFFRNDGDEGEAPSEYFKLEGRIVVAPNPAPEPGSLAILALGLAGLAAASRRKTLS